MSIRPYERPLLALGAVLVVLLMISIFNPRLLLISHPSTSASAAADATANNATGVTSSKNAAPQGASKGEIGNNQGWTHKEKEEAPPRRRPLCSGPEEVSAIGNPKVGIAADQAGHFTLYGLPTPGTALPTQDSYEILRGCVEGIGRGPSYGNETHLKIATGEMSPAGLPTGGDVYSTGEANLASHTKVINEKLVTSYSFGEDIELTQSLELEETGVKISYSISNTSDRAHNVSLRSLLSPTPKLGPIPGRAPFRAGGEGYRTAIKQDTLMTGRDSGRMPTRIYAPRAGAASDASGLWTVPNKSVQPTKVALGGYPRLSGIPFDYDASAGYTMPPNGSIAPYWEDLKIKPGDTLVVVERYVQPGKAAA